MQEQIEREKAARTAQDNAAFKAANPVPAGAIILPMTVTITFRPILE
jgi:hypothetical protein